MLHGFIPIWVLGIAILLIHGVCRGQSEHQAYWVDLLRAEPVAEADAFWNDLRTADVVYLGETHRLKRHHREQVVVLKRLLEGKRPVVLGLEQLERRDQLAIDRFNVGEIDFDGLAEEIDWEAQWVGYRNYRELIETARDGGARIVGLNAPREIIRKIGRSGIGALNAKERMLLPEKIVFDDPIYRRLMDRILLVHAAFDREDLQKVFEAQVARDATMAEALVRAVNAAAGEPSPLAMTVTGSGHIRFGLGVPDRVRTLEPEWRNRILLMSESGDLVLTEREKAASRPVDVTHEDLREIGRAPGDYLFLSPRASSFPK